MTIIISTTFLYLFAVMPLWAALEDPTRPPTAKAATHAVQKRAQRPGWVLTSTLVSAGRRTAVINDKVVARGERVNGARVLSIQSSAVRLKINGREITLMMLKKKIKTLSRVVSSGRSQQR